MTPKIFKHAAIVLVLAGSFASCGKKVESEESETFYYYHFDEKIFLKQVNDKICFRFTLDACEEYLLALISSDASLRTIPSFFFLDREPRLAALESKNGRQISLATVESFKKREKIVSVEYMYLNDYKALVGLNDRITVKLKETISYEQLQEMAEQNHCTIGEENLYVKNQFTLYVCKTSNSNAMQTANMFYETGLFEWSSPIFFSIATAH